MIKAVAFDLVGVLVRENDFKLDDIDAKIERLFGPNLNDNDFIFVFKKKIAIKGNFYLASS